MVWSFNPKHLEISPDVPNAKWFTWQSLQFSWQVNARLCYRNLYSFAGESFLPLPNPLKSHMFLIILGTFQIRIDFWCLYTGTKNIESKCRCIILSKPISKLHLILSCCNHSLRVRTPHKKGYFCKVYIMSNISDKWIKIFNKHLKCCEGKLKTETKMSLVDVLFEIESS